MDAIHIKEQLSLQRRAASVLEATVCQLHARIKGPVAPTLGIYPDLKNTGLDDFSLVRSASDDLKATPVADGPIDRPVSADS
jgi:hypothetical protein